MPFCRLEKYCFNYSVLSIIRANGGDAWTIEKQGYPNFIFYIPPSARHRLRNVFLSHTSHFTGRLIMEMYFLKKNKCILKSCVLLCITVFYLIIYLFFPSFYSFLGPKNFVGPRHSAYSAYWAIWACIWSGWKFLWNVHIMMLLIMQFSSSSCYFVHLWSKYSRYACIHIFVVNTGIQNSIANRDFVLLWSARAKPYGRERQLYARWHFGALRRVSWCPRDF
jgi:hypothetical protein